MSSKFECAGFMFFVIAELFFLNLVVAVQESLALVEKKLFLKMRVIPLILSLFFMSETSAYTYKRIEAIKDQSVNSVKFDAKGNTYAVVRGTKNSKDRLYRINPLNEVFSAVDLPDNYGSEVLVSSTGDAYIDVFSNLTLAIVRANSTEVKEIDSNLSYNLFYLDNKDNLFYCKKNGGVRVLRPNSSSPVPVKNLETCDGMSAAKTISDKSGNTYFLREDNGKDSIGAVENSALQDVTLSATIINVIEQSKEQYINGFMLDAEENLWVIGYEDLPNDSKEGITKRESFIKKFKNGTLKTVLKETRGYLRLAMSSRGKVYVIATTADFMRYSIFYIDSNDEVVEIPELKSLAELTALEYPFLGLADSEGQIYFYASNGELSSSSGMMVTIKSNETKPIPITFKGPDKIQYVKLGFYDDLWISMTSRNTYHLKKGETAANVQIDPPPPEDCDFGAHIDFFYFNPVTRMIYVACSRGLFVLENN